MRFLHASAQHICTMYKAFLRTHRRILLYVLRSQGVLICTRQTNVPRFKWLFSPMSYKSFFPQSYSVSRIPLRIAHIYTFPIGFYEDLWCANVQENKSAFSFSVCARKKTEM
ncbi:hypothetical protein GDO78_019089 [Eleutherodactylus coqui]|uniref:Uncharacterized protein n=1 Tax=Eleutherodactylus coqui TaxID=57060 RepID=A0A8J6BL82_ELECQ|nr:hypothetical protein GDO78_019089 [Eleutherodactylus coqui]